MIDLHCHILPGLDDGARTLEEAVEMAEIAAKEGITTIVATPHLFRSAIPYQDLSQIEVKCKELNQVLQSKNIAVEILAGAEVHIAHNLLEEIKKNRKSLVLHHSSYMFVEFPADHVFTGVKELFFELMSEGVIPIIAHPERNHVFMHNPRLLYELIRMGALSQANRGSFTGLYGKRVRESVHRFLELNLIHAIASDGHNTHFMAPRLKEAMERAALIIGADKAMSLTRDNPAAILNDAEPPYLPEAQDPSEKEKKFKIKLPGFFRK